MDLFVSILAVVFMVYGIGLFFSKDKVAMFAGLICIVSGLYAFNENAFLPLAIGFGLLWLLRIMGLEKR